jgi:ribosomal-protein-alanine N-acetyltransferase
MIRRSKTDDIEQIVAIGREANLSIWTATDYLEEFPRSDSICLTKADENGEVEGFVHGRMGSSAITDEMLFELHNIGVRADRRAKGIGSALFAELRRECIKQGVFQMILNVRVSNETAIKFYEKHNFSVVSTEKGIYSAPVEDGFLMSSLL